MCNTLHAKRPTTEGLGISCRSLYACASAFLTFTILLLHLVSRPPPPSPPPQSCGAPCTRSRSGRARAAACRFLSSARSCSSCRNCLLKAMWWRGIRTPEATPSIVALTKTRYYSRIISSTACVLCTHAHCLRLFSYVDCMFFLIL